MLGASYGAKVDLWSVGVILYGILSQFVLHCMYVLIFILYNLTVRRNVVW